MSGAAGRLALAASLGIAVLAFRQSQPTPLQLFQRMMPVIRDPRCTNCHGVVDPVTGRNHHGGAIHRDTSCILACHLAAEEWQIPGREHFFAGRTDREICSQVSDFVTTFGRTDFMEKHIKADDQIIQAFDGFAGGAREPGKVYADGTIGPPGAKPPMDHTEFIRLADDWVTRGNAACVLEGTIQWEESVNSVDTIVNSPAQTHIARQTGSRTVTITSSGSRFRADITARSDIISSDTLRLNTDRGPCTVVTSIRTLSTSATTGPATVTIKDTAFMTPLPQPPQADYRIDVQLPPEKVQRTSSIVVANGCGTGLTSPPGESLTLDFDEWDFTLEGRVADVRGNAIGGCVRSVKHDDVGKTLPMSVASCNRWGHMGNAREPWLMNHGADVAFHDGSSIPFQVNVSWNLRRR